MKKKSSKKEFFRKQEKRARKREARKENKTKQDVKQQIEAGQRVVGTFQRNKNFGFVIPDCRRIPTDIFISKKNCMGARNNEKVIVEIVKEPKKGRKIEGKVVEIVGNANEAGIDMLALIREYELPYEFPKPVINELSYISDKVAKKDIPNRVDLRGEEIFTIDGEDAKDLDDAVAVKKNEDGRYT